MRSAKKNVQTAESTVSELLTGTKTDDCFTISGCKRGDAAGDAFG